MFYSAKMGLKENKISLQTRLLGSLLKSHFLIAIGEYDGKKQHSILNTLMQLLDFKMMATCSLHLVVVALIISFIVLVGTVQINFN